MEKEGVNGWNSERHLDSASLYLGVRLTLPLNSTNATSIPLRFISVFV